MDRQPLTSASATVAFAAGAEFAAQFPSLRLIAVKGADGWWAVFPAATCRITATTITLELPSGPIFREPDATACVEFIEGYAECQPPSPEETLH